MGKLEFKEDYVTLVLRDKSYDFAYTNVLREKLIQYKINLPFRLWILVLTKIKS